MRIRFLVLLALALASHGQAPDHGPLATLESASVPERYPEIAADDLAPNEIRLPAGNRGDTQTHAYARLHLKSPGREGSVGDLVILYTDSFQVRLDPDCREATVILRAQDRLTPEQANVSIHATLQNQGFSLAADGAGGLKLAG